jgi:AcrR family transcriptional regulator
MITMQKISLREDFKNQIRARTLQTARELFEHEGYGSFSMRKLAAQLGYSPSAVYKHFANKNEIFDCLVDESFAALMAASSGVVDLPGESPIDRLKRGMWAYVNFGLKHPDHYRFAFLVRRPGGVIINRPVYQGLKGRVQACVEAGYFAGGDISLLAQLLWAAVHGITSLLILKPDFPWAPKEKLIGRTIDSAVHGLVVPARREATKA